MAKYKKPRRKFSAILYGERQKLRGYDGLHKVGRLITQYYTTECYGPYKYRTVIKMIKEYSDGDVPQFNALKDLASDIMQYCRVMNDKYGSSKLNSRQRATLKFVIIKELEIFLLEYHKKINNKIGAK